MATVSDILDKFLHEPDKIQDVVRSAAGNEYYFRFGKHFFSVLERRESDSVRRFGAYSLYVYPAFEGDTAVLADLNEQMELANMVAYNQQDLPQGADKANLARVYKVLEEKIHNIPGLFDEVVNS